MPIDLMIPFGILIVMVVYFIYSRGKFEKSIVSTYEEKFENWKKHNPTVEKNESCKEFVGLIFKKDGKIEIEVFDEMVKSRLEKAKFNIKVK